MVNERFCFIYFPCWSLLFWLSIKIVTQSDKWFPKYPAKHVIKLQNTPNCQNSANASQIGFCSSFCNRYMSICNFAYNNIKSNSKNVLLFTNFRIVLHVEFTVDNLENFLTKPLSTNHTLTKTKYLFIL